MGGAKACNAGLLRDPAVCGVWTCDSLCVLGAGSDDTGQLWHLRTFAGYSACLYGRVAYGPTVDKLQGWNHCCHRGSCENQCPLTHHSQPLAPSL